MVLNSGGRELLYRSVSGLPVTLHECRTEYDADERKRKKRAERIDELWKSLQDKTLKDDVLFRIVMHRNTELADFIASFFIPDYERGCIEEVVSNYEIPHAVTKTSRLDAYAESDSCIIHIEMQNEREDWSFSRAWQYNSNIINSFILRGGEYTSLPRVAHIIFMNWDVYGGGRPYYALTMKDQDGIERDKSVMFIYVNMNYRGSDRYGRLNADLECKNYRKMYYNVLRRNVERIKSVKGGMNMAKNLFEQMVEEEVAIELEEAKAELKAKIYDEVKAECHAEGRAEGRESFLRILLKESSPTKISRKYGISLEEINSVAGSMMA